MTRDWYYVLDPAYNKYMDIQQAINLALLERLAARGIAFSHPMRMLQVAPEQARAFVETLRQVSPSVGKAA